MSADFLSSIAGAALSLAFSYLPGASDWFGQLDGTRKRLVMLGLLLLTSLAVFALSCSAWASDLGLEIACSQSGAIGLARSFLLALVANQAAFSISPPPNPSNHAERSSSHAG